GVRREMCGSEQMRIDITDAEAMQPMPLDEVENFVFSCHDGLGQCTQCIKYPSTLAQLAQCQLSDDKGMCEHLSGIEILRELLVALTQVIHPHRRVDQNHRPIPNRPSGQNGDAESVLTRTRCHRDEPAFVRFPVRSALSGLRVPAWTFPAGQLRTVPAR